MGVDEQKSQMRSAMKMALAAMGDEDRRGRSDEICAQIERLDVYRDASTIMMYAAMPGEVDLDGLMRSALESGKRVCVPRVDWDASAMVPAAIANLDSDLVVGRYGVRSAGGNCVEIPVSGLELVLVPGLAFDRDGGRLGRGGGFYDRLLGGDIGCPVIGVCFACQVVGCVASESHDCAVDRVVCEDGELEREHG